MASYNPDWTGSKKYDVYTFTNCSHAVWFNHGVVPADVERCIVCGKENDGLVFKETIEKFNTPVVSC